MRGVNNQNERSVTRGVSGFYILDIRHEQKIYRYDVSVSWLLPPINDDQERKRDLTLKGSDGGKKGNYSTVCIDAVNLIYNRSQGFNSNGQASFVYDGSKTLFTNAEIQISKTHEFQVADLSINSNAILGKRGKLLIEIQPCKTPQHVIDISELGNPDLKFFDLLTSQSFVNNGSQTVVGRGLVFNNEPCRTLPSGVANAHAVALHRGFSKRVAVIKGDGIPKAALIFDVKTCAFFASATIETIYNELLRNERNRGNQNSSSKFVTSMKGVKFCLTYDQSRIFKFGGFTQRNAREMMITTADGNELSINEYFHQHKGISLSNPNLPLIRPEVNNNAVFRNTVFPMQCCKILPFQRIKVEKMSEVLSRELLKENTIPPHHRYTAIQKAAQEVGGQEGECGQFMQRFGVTMIPRSNYVEIGSCRPPSIKFGDKTVTPRNGRFDERYYNYFCASSLLKNFVVAHPSQIDRHDIENFIKNLLDLANRKGLHLPRPERRIIELDDLAEKMLELTQEKKQFLMYIDSKYVKSHGVLKLNERIATILTQHVSIEAIQKGGLSTMANILNKMHIKVSFNDGINYIPIMGNVGNNQLNLSTGRILVIGLDSSNIGEGLYSGDHQQNEGSSTEPTVVGMTGNFVRQCFNFCGTYFYQPASKDAAINQDILQKGTIWMLNMVRESRPHLPPPSIVFIIRKGLGEGEVPNAVRSEFTAIRKAFLDFGTTSKFIFSVVTKSHSKRFFAFDNQNIRNLSPGSVIDSGIVKYGLKEFYLQSHLPLKGSGKAVQYTFPINEIDATNDELQAFLNSLCHNWQIVNTATSLPSPVQQAYELVKRGKNNFMELKKTHPENIPRLGNSIDFNQLNSRLNYEGNYIFAKTRFNA